MIGGNSENPNNPYLGMHGNPHIINNEGSEQRGPKLDSDDFVTDAVQQKIKGERKRDEDNVDLSMMSQKPLKKEDIN